MMTTIKINLTSAQIAGLKQFAADNYDPALGVTWRDVAVGWAEHGIMTRLSTACEEAYVEIVNFEMCPCGQTTTTRAITCSVTE